MDLDAELSPYTHLWEGREDWVLRRSRHETVLLTVVFAGPVPSVDELVALRHLSEDLRALPVRELKARLAGARDVSLGRFSPEAARDLEARAARSPTPLALHARRELHVSHLPLLRQPDGGQSALLIEDERLNERVIQEMLKRGVPVLESGEASPG